MHAAVLTIALLTPAAEPTTPDVTQTVRTGLKWLATQQKPAGNWEGLNSVSTTSLTAFAGVALLMEGSTPNAGTYAPQIRKAVEWMEKNAGADGRITSNTDNDRFQYVISHSQAILFLSCAYDVDDDADRRTRLVKVLDKAIAFAVVCQTPRGGWSPSMPAQSGDYDDSLSTATVLHALLAARKVGLAVPKTATDKAIQYLVRSTNRDGGIIYSNFGGAVPRGNDGQPNISAAAAAGLLTADGRRPESLPLWAKFGQRDAINQLQFIRTNGSGILLYQYHAARGAFALGETGHRRLQPDAPEANLVRWSAYRAASYKALKDAQAKDGSWPDQVFGPQYSSALALFILQLDNDYLPAFSR